MFLLLTLACAHLGGPKGGPPVDLDPSARLSIVSPVAGIYPYTLDFSVEAVGEVDRVQLWADDTLLGEIQPGEPLRWRSPTRGALEITAFALRDGVAVARDEVEVTVGEGLSDRVQAALSRYPTDGSYGFYWPPDDGIWWGTTRDVWYRGVLLSPGDPGRQSHCVGLTWELAMEVLSAEAGGVDQPINGLSPEQIVEFRTDWFVRELLGAGAADAVVNYGVGERVAKEDLRPGDFIQIWGTGLGGHSAVFQSWILKRRKVVGVRYWSTHPGTSGIGIREEYYDKGLSKAFFFGARLWRAVDWKPVEGSAS